MLIELLGALWIVFGLVGILCVALPRLRRDPLLYGAAGVAAGLTASVLLCMHAWLAGGGWGPPVPVVFGVLGIIAGIVFAVATRPRDSLEMA